MRNPPGYGTIVDLGKNRRRPIAVRVPNGKKFNKQGVEINDYKYLDYFPRTPEGKTAAIDLLAKYNAGVNVRTMPNISYCPTFKELFELWLDRHTENLRKKKGGVSDQLVTSYKSAFKKCKPIHGKRIDKIQFQDIQDIADDISEMSYSTVLNVKIILNFTFDLARKQKYIAENFVSDIEFIYKTNDESKHSMFSRKEVDMLWNNKDDFNVRIILIMIYTGFRIEELLSQLTDKVYIADRYMIGGIKTKAGKDRIIPISRKIMPFIEEIYDEGNIYLLQRQDNRYWRNSFLIEIWNPAMEKLGMKHLPHDTKYTCASLLDRAGVNENCKKMILGHKRQDVTNGVYVQKDLLDLISAIDMI